MTGVETSESRRFAIIGVAGYIAPRHLNAMRSLGCDLVAAHDVFDSVGMIDGYFPRAYFTTDPDDFRKRMVADRAEFLTVCTPNYLHCTHTVTGLEAGLCGKRNLAQASAPETAVCQDCHYRFIFSHDAASQKGVSCRKADQ